MFGGSLVDRGHAVGPTFSFWTRPPRELVLPAASRMLHLLTTGPTMGMGRQCLCLFSRDASCVSLHAPFSPCALPRPQIRVCAIGFVCGGASALWHYAVKEGDHLTLLNVYAGFEAAKRNAQWSAARLINHRSMRNAARRANARQLHQQAGRASRVVRPQRHGSTAHYHCCLLCNAAKLESSGSYRTIRASSKSSSIFQCSISTRAHRCCHELTVSTKPYILGVLQIEPQWLVSCTALYQFKGTSTHNGAGRGAEQGENALGVRKQARHI